MNGAAFTLKNGRQDSRPFFVVDSSQWMLRAQNVEDTFDAVGAAMGGAIDWNLDR